MIQKVLIQGRLTFEYASVKCVFVQCHFNVTYIAYTCTRCCVVCTQGTFNIKGFCTKIAKPVVVHCCFNEGLFVFSTSVAQMGGNSDGLSVLTVTTSTL